MSSSQSSHRLSLEQEESPLIFSYSAFRYFDDSPRVATSLSTVANASSSSGSPLLQSVESAATGLVMAQANSGIAISDKGTVVVGTANVVTPSTIHDGQLTRVATLITCTPITDPPAKGHTEGQEINTSGGEAKELDAVTPKRHKSHLAFVSWFTSPSKRRSPLKSEYRPNTLSRPVATVVVPSTAPVPPIPIPSKDTPTRVKPIANDSIQNEALPEDPLPAAPPLSVKPYVHPVTRTLSSMSMTSFEPQASNSSISVVIGLNHWVQGIAEEKKRPVKSGLSRPHDLDLVGEHYTIAPRGTSSDGNSSSTRSHDEGRLLDDPNSGASTEASSIAPDPAYDDHSTDKKASQPDNPGTIGLGIYSPLLAGPRNDIHLADHIEPVGTNAPSAYMAAMGRGVTPDEPLPPATSSSSLPTPSSGVTSTKPPKHSRFGFRNGTNRAFTKHHDLDEPSPKADGGETKDADSAPSTPRQSELASGSLDHIPAHRHGLRETLTGKFVGHVMRRELSANGFLREADRLEEEAHKKMEDAESSLTWRQRTRVERERAKNNKMMATLSKRQHQISKKELEHVKADLIRLQKRHKELQLEDAHALSAVTKLRTAHAKADNEMLELKSQYEAQVSKVAKLAEDLKATEEMKVEKEFIALEAGDRLNERTRDVERLKHGYEIEERGHDSPVLGQYCLVDDVDICSSG